MILDVNKIFYDYLDIKIEGEMKGIYMLTYRTYEFCTLMDKLNLFDKLEDVVKKNNGIICGDYDEFHCEEDVIDAMNDFKEIFSNNEYQEQIFKKFLEEYKLKDPNLEKLQKYLFMFDASSIETLLLLK